MAACQSLGVLGPCRASPGAVVMAEQESGAALATEAPAADGLKLENSHQSRAFGATPETACSASEGNLTCRD